jgi:hypothetical protein
MKSQNLITNLGSTPGSVAPPAVPEEGEKNGPSPAEIRKRAFEIHIERGGIHGCDLEDWMQAEREFQQKYQNNGEDPKTK